jgi:hypothetical protein
MNKFMGIALISISTVSFSVAALAKPPNSQTPSFQNPASVRPAVKPTPLPLGICRVDLSVERITVSRLPPGRGWNVAVTYKNIGLDAYDAPASFAGLVLEETIGTYVHGWPVGDIASLEPGASVTLTQTISATSAAVRPVRAYLNFGPDAPRCGIDTNRTNDQLSIAGDHLSEWSASSRPVLDVRR